jgi:ribosomal protein L29
MKRTLLPGSLLLLAAAVGCETRVSQKDVNRQQKEVSRLETKVQELEARKHTEPAVAAEEARQEKREDIADRIDSTKKELADERSQLVALEERRAFEAQMEARLDEFDKQIDTLEERAATADGERKVELEKQVAEFKARHDMLQRDLTKMRAESGDGWSQMKLSMEKAWHDASTQVSTAIDDDAT